jgi:hypothetical protein
MKIAFAGSVGNLLQKHTGITDGFGRQLEVVLILHSSLNFGAVYPL